MFLSAPVPAALACSSPAFASTPAMPPELEQSFKTVSELFSGEGEWRWKDGNRPFGKELKPNPERKGREGAGRGDYGRFLQREMPGLDPQELQPCRGPGGSLGACWRLLVVTAFFFFFFF